MDQGKTALKTGLIERISYGMGDFGCNIIYVATSSFLLFYYTDYAGVSAAAVGMIMFISRILDAFVTIIMGMLVDRTNSKYGKARVWLLRMSIPLAISGILLFCVPAGWGSVAKLVYVFLTYNLSSTIMYTSINVPYSSLNALMTQDPYERSLLAIFRNFFATGGGLLINVILLPMVEFFGDDMVAWTKTMGVLCFFMVIALLLSFLGTKERVQAVNQENDKGLSLTDTIKAFSENKYGLMLMSIFVFVFVYYAINGGSTVYFAKDVLGNKNLMNILNGFSNVAQIASLFLIARLIRLYGKKKVLIVGLVLQGAGLILLDLYGGLSVMLWLGSGLRGMGNGCFGATIWAMISDTIDYGEWKNGCRMEGFINSIISVGYKIGNGIGSALLGLMISISGYNSEAGSQSASAIRAIHLSFAWIPILMFVIIFIILCFYKLDDEFDMVIEELKKRKR